MNIIEENSTNKNNDSKFEFLEKNKEYIKKSLSHYYSNVIFLKCFKRIPLSRYESFNFILNHIQKNNNTNILELGTTRSFVDGRFKGCNSNNTKFWNENEPEKWDWSAGMFTKIIGESFKSKKFKITTVDMCKDHLDRCNHITKNLNNINFINSKSDDFLSNSDDTFDIIYIDTGDNLPVEENGLMHLMEVHLIYERNLLNINGLVIFDDVKNPDIHNSGENDPFGKYKYAIPYLLEKGYNIVFDEYQTILHKYS